MVAVGAVVCAAAACAIDIPDVIDGGGDATSPDAAANDVVEIDVQVSCDAGACGAPAGFAPVLFAADRTTACPTGMQTLDLAADPGTATESACPCDCTVTKQPGCVPTTLNHELDQFASLDGGISCTATGTPLPVDGTCDRIDASTGLHVYAAWSIPPVPPAVPGQCTTTAQPDPSAVPSTPARVCVDPTCAGVCAAPAGFRACAFASGSVACPAGWTEEHHLGTVAVSCNACSACSVSLDGGCQGTLSLYSDPSCSTLIEKASVDGGCAANVAFGQTAYSYMYNPVAVGLVCTPGKSSGGPVSLTGEVTVCCP
jgi:hypothetical protein